MLLNGVSVRSRSFETAIICKYSHPCCGALSNWWYRLIVTVVETEGKGNSTLTCTCILLHAAVDPLIPNRADRATRFRSQQEVR
jgi:hypothetical protein